MGICHYYEILIQGYTPVLNEARRKCYDVGERWYILHNGNASKAHGLVTSGAGPCMVVVVHDETTNRGCMTHITENLNDKKSFYLADEIIQHMISNLIGDENADNIQIFLFQGQNRFRRYTTYLDSEGIFGRCNINNHIDNGFSNYLYLPKRCEIFPVTRPIADELSNPGPGTELPYSLDARKISYEFKINYTNRWGEFISNQYLI